MLEYWFLLPIGILIAFAAMSAGISGAALWVPVYLVWLRLDPPIAFWLGLFTMLFGFGSGSYRFWRDGIYNSTMVNSYSAASVPSALAGGYISELLPQRLIVGGFGAFVLLYGAWLWLSAGMKHGDRPRRDSVVYPAAVFEGVLTGLISVGSGVLTIPSMLRSPSIRVPAEAVGSGVMIIFFTSLGAAVGRLRPALVARLVHDFPHLMAIAIWAVPAVIIGGQLGPRLARAMPSERHARIYLGAMLLLVAIFTLMRAYQAK